MRSFINCPLPGILLGRWNEVGATFNNTRGANEKFIKDFSWETWNDDNVDGVILRLWTAATNWSVFHPSGDVRTWSTMTEWYREGKTPDSSTRTNWQSYKQSHLVAKQEELAREVMNLAAQSIFLYTSKGFLTCRKILRHGTDGFIYPPKARSADFYRL